MTHDMHAQMMYRLCPVAVAYTRRSRAAAGPRPPPASKPSPVTPSSVCAAAAVEPVCCDSPRAVGV